MQAPEFSKNLEWFNTSEPITLESQRGHFVLLDFWTYCCINCLHILPDLHYLADKYADCLTIIGIHSPKFTNERVANHVSDAIARYGINHPVAHDPNLTTWLAYRVHAWPTLILINPVGEIVGHFSGEGHRHEIAQVLDQHIALAKQQHTYQPKPQHQAAVIASSDKTQLYFPSKILATKDKLYVSDSGHHRILEITLNGHVLRQFGCGSAGFADGPSEQASFNCPQGLALSGKTLLIADTNNHAIRAIDLKSGAVTTIMGTGKQADSAHTFSNAEKNVALNSPWALACSNDKLYIAMAGWHQIWMMDLKTKKIKILSGSGIEHLVDGLPFQAAFAQPSGLSLAQDKLFIADAETSAIRALNLLDYHTTTLVGVGLFDFGDRDGNSHQARLQHPLDIAWDNTLNCLWIIDSYNHKLKRLNLTVGAVTTFPITTPLAEPSGIAIKNGIIWIANTNHHNLVSVDTVTGLSVVTPIQF